MSNNTIKKVGILRGMAGEHYESSLKKGGDIISHISEHLQDTWRPIDIFVDKNYVWHLGGVPVNPSDLMHKIDLVWNLSHPSLSNILESLSIPNIGISAFSSLLEKNREILREHAKKVGIKMSRRIVIPLYQKDFDGSRDRYVIKKAKEVFEKFGAPWIIKSFVPDPSMGVHVAKSTEGGSPDSQSKFRAKTFSELINSIEDGVAHQQSISVEEFIEGKPFSAHSVPGFRRDLPAQAGDIYIFSPANLASSDKEKLTVLVKELHDHIGAKHYLKSDFILHPRRGFFLTDIELLPDLTKGSHFEQSCESVGAKMHHLVEHILESTLQR